MLACPLLQPTGGMQMKVYAVSDCRSLGRLHGPRNLEDQPCVHPITAGHDPGGAEGAECHHLCLRRNRLRQDAQHGGDAH